MKQSETIKVTLESDLMDHLSESFAMDFQVTTNEIDNLGYLSDAHCLNWMNTVHLAHLVHLGITPTALRQSKTSFVSTQLILEGKRPVKIDDTLRIGTELRRGQDENFLRRKFQIVQVREAVTVGIAVIDYLCVRIEDLKPAQIPAGLVDFLGQSDIESEETDNESV